MIILVTECTWKSAAKTRHYLLRSFCFLSATLICTKSKTSTGSFKDRHLDLVKMLAQKQAARHIFPNGGLIVIYHGSK